MAQLGIEHTLASLADIEKLAIEGIKLAKNGVGIGSIRDLLALGGDAKKLVTEAKESFPELKDLDAAEGLQLGQACLDLVKNIIFSVAV